MSVIDDLEAMIEHSKREVAPEPVGYFLGSVLEAICPEQFRARGMRRDRVYLVPEAAYFRLLEGALGQHGTVAEAVQGIPEEPQQHEDPEDALDVDARPDGYE